jgi:ribonuclease HI
MKTLTIYTDGASRGNPGPSGWGAVILVGPPAGGYAMEIAGGSKKATNNQMELQAVLEVLSDSGARAHKGPVIVYSDSAYVVNGLNSWVYGWEKKGWITSTKTPVENKTIWVKLLELLKEYGKRLSIEKVSGHAGDLYNERCDELAVNAALGKKETHFKGAQKDYDKFLEEIGTTKKSARGGSALGRKKSTGQAYSYVSMVGGKVYADKTWKECEARVKGKKGAKYQKVFSKAEETSLVQDYTLKTLL